MKNSARTQTNGSFVTWRNERDFFFILRNNQKGDRIDRHLDRKSNWAEHNDRDGLARHVDRKGDRIDSHLDRKGSRADSHLDRKGNRFERRWDRNRA